VSTFVDTVSAQADTRRTAPSGRDFNRWGQYTQINLKMKE